MIINIETNIARLNYIHYIMFYVCIRYYDDDCFKADPLSRAWAFKVPTCTSSNFSVELRFITSFFLFFFSFGYNFLPIHLNVVFLLTVSFS